MSDDVSHYIPRRLDDPPKLLFFDQDVGMIGVLVMGVGVAVGFPLIGLAMGVMVGFFLNKLKAGGHPGMTAHLGYWVTGIPAPKSLPPSHVRELNG